MLKADRHDYSNGFNFKNVGGPKAACGVATGHNMLTLSGVACMYTFLMNTWNTLPESYQ
jgi:hypothetical protein